MYMYMYQCLRGRDSLLDGRHALAYYTFVHFAERTCRRGSCPGGLSEPSMQRPVVSFSSYLTKRGHMQIKWLHR